MFIDLIFFLKGLQFELVYYIIHESSSNDFEWFFIQLQSNVITDVHTFIYIYMYLYIDVYV